MKRNVIETVIGALVLLVAAVFLVFAYRSADLGQTAGGYTLVASFSQTGGLKEGSDVRIGGVKVGSVSGLVLDQDTYMAKVSLAIEPAIKLPRDTVARIASESLLGGRYVSLDPGGEEEFMKNGDSFEHVQGAVDLETLIGKTIFNPDGGKTPAAQGAATAP
ncbi:MAG: outer membrane lipid asymmetry maintenance protein MlaD [Pseudomonadota bacterium]|nr:outer membrane lipid asymmetry maintenance protein MlaD [Pseudomonadota bacterium]